MHGYYSARIILEVKFDKCLPFFLRTLEVPDSEEEPKTQHVSMKDSSEEQVDELKVLGDEDEIDLQLERAANTIDDPVCLNLYI